MYSNFQSDHLLKNAITVQMELLRKWNYHIYKKIIKFAFLYFFQLFHLKNKFSFSKFLFPWKMWHKWRMESSWVKLVCLKNRFYKGNFLLWIDVKTKTFQLFILAFECLCDCLQKFKQNTSVFKIPTKILII